MSDTGIAEDTNAGAIDVLRRSLVLGYRILGMNGHGRGLLAHLTARLPGAQTFWSYQLGQSVEEVVLGDLTEVDFPLRPVTGAGRVNPTLTSHGAIYEATPEVNCIVHHHGDNCVALGAIGANLEPFDNNAARWHGDIALVEDYQDTFSIAEQGRIMAQQFRQHKALILKHHGVTVACASVAEAVIRAIEVEQSAGVQLKAMAAGNLHVMPAGAIAECKKFLNSPVYFDGMWNYMKRRAVREGHDPGGEVDDRSSASLS